MSFGGGGKPPVPPPPPAPPPMRIAPEVEKAKDDLREQLKRARSRAASFATASGLLDEAQTKRPALLSGKLGGF